MAADEEKAACFTFLQQLKRKGKYIPGFEESLTILEKEAATRGLENEDIALIIDIVWKAELGAAKCVSLIKSMIPKYRVSDSVLKDMITWCVTSFDKTPVTVSTIVLQWIVGLWEYDLADRETINIFYEHFFLALLHKEKLEVHLARLIYELTKPEDVTRRAVIRLVTHQKSYKKPRKHLNALLSLFKSYKPELVPEKIPAVGIGSTWKPIPEQLRLGFVDAKSRASIHEVRQRSQENFKWIIAQTSKMRKSKEPVLPSVGYFHMGSSIYKEKDTKSIFDLGNMEDLGKYHTSVELPCNATSLLTNMAGYHLLMFADFEYQNRFSYNLYNLLRRVFLIEPGMYPREELDKLLDMTYEFLRYIQHGIPMVSRFLDEYLACRMGEHHQKLLALLQWTSLSTSVLELQELVLQHLRLMFNESSLEEKCEIIKTLRLLLLNLFVNSNVRSYPESRASPFLGQKYTINLNDIVPEVVKFTQYLIVTGLNIHSHSSLLMTEALSFYEQMVLLENHYNLDLWTLAPSAVIYGGIISRSLLILSRVCSLLLEYRKSTIRLRKLNVQKKFAKELEVLTTYANDFIGALWYEESFSVRQQGNAIFLKRLSNKAVEDLSINYLDSMLSLNHHYAVLPYKYTLTMANLGIYTKEDMFCVAVQYFPPVSDLLRAMGVMKE